MVYLRVLLRSGGHKSRVFQQLTIPLPNHFINTYCNILPVVQQEVWVPHVIRVDHEAVDSVVSLRVPTHRLVLPSLSHKINIKKTSTEEQFGKPVT